MRGVLLCVACSATASSTLAHADEAGDPAAHASEGGGIMATVATVGALGLGVGGGASFGDGNPGRAVASTFASSTLALPAALFLDVLDGEPCTSGNDSGYQIYNDVWCVVRAGGYLAGVAAGGGLGTLGVYATAQLGGTSHVEGAYAGAFAGGAAGALLSVGATKLLRKYAPRVGRTMRAVLASALVGSGATLGYQLAR